VLVLFHIDVIENFVDELMWYPHITKLGITEEFDAGVEVWF
jgi:hypothetical protein